METPSRAFEIALIDGPLVVSTAGDLWQRLPDPEGDMPRWSYFGPVAGVEPGSVAERLGPNLARLQSSAVAAQHATGIR